MHPIRFHALAAPLALALAVAVGAPAYADLLENLKYVHGAVLLGTISLGLLTLYGGNSATYQPIHQILGLTTLGAMGLSAGVVAYGE